MVAGVAAAAAGCGPEGAPPGDSCIAPANPGGGWDLTCRATAVVLQSIDSSAPPLRVTNLPGGGGATAFAQVVDAMRGDSTVIIAASPSTLLGLAQKHYGASTERDVRWLAALGAEPSVVAVRRDAPWRTLSELVQAWRAAPEEITSGGVSVEGGQDHIKMLLLARAAGVDLTRVKYRSLSGPVEALAALERGEIRVFPGDASEVQRLVETKGVRILAVLGERRATGVLADVPTAREQGFDVSWEVWRGFYAPPGISDAAYARWIARLSAMRQSPGWEAIMARNGLTPFAMDGADFEQFVREQTAAFRTVSSAIGVIP